MNRSNVLEWQGPTLFRSVLSAGAAHEKLAPVMLLLLCAAPPVLGAWIALAAP